MTELLGLVTKNQNGYYSVIAESTNHYLCKVRGKMKQHDNRVLVGDWVKICPIDSTQAVITEICPRRNRLLRPPVANLDQVLIVVSVAMPSINQLLLDRLIMMCELNHIVPILCFTKMDLLTSQADDLLSIYSSFPYAIYKLNNSGRAVDENEITLAQIRIQLQNKVTSVCGQSGVGKSTLLNAIFKENRFITQAISNRIGRGKNTTRHAVLHELYTGSYIADTPGFASLGYLPDTRGDIMSGFCEIAQRQAQCKFHDCTHRNEPNCAVKEALKSGAIAPERYQSYLALLMEWEDREKEMFR